MGFSAWMSVAACLLCTMPAYAQRALSLDEALELARAHNRDLRAARARLEQSATNVQRAWAALLPQASMQGKYTHNYKEVDLDLSILTQPSLSLADAIQSASGNPALNNAVAQYEQNLQGSLAGQQLVKTIQKGEQLDFSANLTVPLLVPFAYPALDSAKQTHKANLASYAMTEATVLLGVAQAYYAAAGSDELVVARKNAVAVHLETYDQAQTRFQSGVVNHVEVMRAEVAWVRAEQALVEAEDAAAQVYLSLETLLGFHEPFRVIPSQGDSAEPPPLDDLLSSARQLRPEFMFHRYSINAATLAARSSLWQWAPTLSAFGNVAAYNYQSFSGDNYAWSIGAQLGIVLYDGGTRDAQRRLAWAQRKESEARLDLLQDSVAESVKNARRALSVKRRALSAAQRSLELASETLRLIRKQHEAGTALQLDVLQAQDSLVQAEVAVAQARFDLALAGTQLSYATGAFPFSRRVP